MDADTAIRLPHLHADLARSMASLRADQRDVRQARAVVHTALVDGKAHYGINTGFGALASKRIDSQQVEKLQENLLLSHAVGLGDSVPRDITRLMLQLKIHALGKGHSGISLEVFQRLLQLEQADLIPVVPSKGSLGASGDLAPLAHMALPLLGRGRIWNPQGSDSLEAADLLKQHDLPPVKLGAKDGLALINGTQLMSAYGAHVLHRAATLVKTVDVLAAMSLEALRGSLQPFDARIHALRPHPGQGQVAANVRALLQDSEVLESHRECHRVQDPYSLRCVPQVHGASRDALGHASGVLEIELESVTDNPLVFADGDVLSGGNFHGQPLALCLDHAAIALAELASISERRCYLLLTGLGDLPTLLMKDTGLNSGFMIPQYTAAALVSQNKVLCHPASVDSIPTCLGQEDHVSMGSISALKLLEVLHNMEQVLAIEALTAAQALDYRAPLRPGRGVQAAHARVRTEVSHRDADGFFGDDIRQCVDLLRQGSLVEAAEQEIGALG